MFLKVNNKKENILKEYFDLEKGRINCQKFLDKYKFDYLIIDSNDLLYVTIRDTNYELVYEYYDNKDMINYQIYKRRWDY